MISFFHEIVWQILAPIYREVKRFCQFLELRRGTKWQYFILFFLVGCETGSTIRERIKVHRFIHFLRIFRSCNTGWQGWHFCRPSPLWLKWLELLTIISHLFQYNVWNNLQCNSQIIVFVSQFLVVSVLTKTKKKVDSSTATINFIIVPEEGILSTTATAIAFKIIPSYIKLFVSP